MDPDKEEFYREVQGLVATFASNSFILSSDKYDKLIEKVKESNLKIKKSPVDYRRIRRYNVVTTPEGERLMTPAAARKPTYHFVKLEEMYDIIREYHLKLNHAGRSRMMKSIKTKYRNITCSVVIVYLNLCEGCKNKFSRTKRTKRNKSEITTLNLFNIASEMDTLSKNDPLNLRSGSLADLDYNIEEEIKVFPELYSRGQFEILDIKSEEEYKYLMVYRNLVTKFIHLKPLKTIDIAESVNALLDIFLVFGAPNILQSKNGRPVTKQICRRMYTIFSDIKIVSAEMIKNYQEIPGQSNADILKMLGIWLKQNNSQKWYDGVKYVQYTLNNLFNLSIAQTPIEFVFGNNPKRGIASFMTKAEYENLFNEKELRTALEKKESGSNSDELIIDEPLVPTESFIKSDPEESDAEFIAGL